eukprot:179843-Pelagomonas_calceolata.AAC.1
MLLCGLLRGCSRAELLTFRWRVERVGIDSGVGGHLNKMNVVKEWEESTKARDTRLNMPARTT